MSVTHIKNKTSEVFVRFFFQGLTVDCPSLFGCLCHSNIHDEDACEASIICGLDLNSVQTFHLEELCPKNSQVQLLTNVDGNGNQVCKFQRCGKFNAKKMKNWTSRMSLSETSAFFVFEGNVRQI